MACCPKPQNHYLKSYDNFVISFLQAHFDENFIEIPHF